MTTCSSNMRRSAVIILMLNSFCVFSQIPHECTYIMSCFDNGTTGVQLEYDDEEIFYVDFKRHEVVYTVPLIDASKRVELQYIYRDAVGAKSACAGLMAYLKLEGIQPPEEKDPPESVLYPVEEVEPGVENSLICFVNHFYPPTIKVSWTKNGHPVSKGVSLSRFLPNSDQTFHQFSTLRFTPSVGDIYSCTVEHPALETPKTRIWEPDFRRQSLGPDVFCGVGLGLGLLGVTAGTFLFVKGLQAK